MHVIATFENSIFIELALSALELKGIPKEQIFVAPLDKRTEPKQLFDTIHRADGFSLFDVSAILGTCFMLLGAIYGYVLTWGPIIWGIIGALFGVFTGFFIKLFMVKKSGNGQKKLTSEVVMIIYCEEQQWQTIEKILWDNHALGLTTIH